MVQMLYHTAYPAHFNFVALEGICFADLYPICVAHCKSCACVVMEFNDLCLLLEGMSTY